MATTEMTVIVKVDEPEIKFALMIGRLDRLLSEFLIAAGNPDIDEADRQTLEHHADDLIGVGNAALRKLQISTQTELPLHIRCSTPDCPNTRMTGTRFCSKCDMAIP